MADRNVGGIFASSFVAGSLLAAAIFAPGAWEPVPEPFFGLDEQTLQPPLLQPSARIEPSAGRPARLAMNASSAGSAAVMAQVLVTPLDRQPQGLQPPEMQSPEMQSPDRQSENRQLATAAPQGPAGSVHIPETFSLPAAPPLPSVDPPAAVMPPRSQSTAPSQNQAEPSPPPLSELPQPGQEADPESMRALVNRVQSARPPSPSATHHHPLRFAPPAVAQPLVRAQGGPRSPVAAEDRGAGSSLGAAPLPGDEMFDSDSINWAGPSSVAGTSRQATDPLPRPAANAAQRFGLGQRLRIADRLRGRGRAAIIDADAGAPATTTSEPHHAAPDITVWPAPSRLIIQLRHVASGEASRHDPATAWAMRAVAKLQDVLATVGPRDAAAEQPLVALGESAIEGIGIADTVVDQSHAANTRRAALAVSRRVAVWHAANSLCRSLDDADDDAAGENGRMLVEVARLLDAVERYESTAIPADANVAAMATRVIEESGNACGLGLVKAVRDHYQAANLRIAVHQQFLEKMLPGATVTTAPVDEYVLGRKVRGTRTVERTTTIRFTPDSDEICFDLEVHGDVASRTVTDAGTASLTSHGDSSFTVRKPIKVCSEGLLFGSATAVATNRSQLANVQTSFDSVPIMRSLVRNIVRNQHAESLPEANREVTDRITSTACREVDAQAEPRFTEMSERIRERVWSPMVRLGLEPTTVAMETTQTTATLRLRLAADGQLAAHTPRPRAPAEASLSLQLHESTVNNALERLGLGGRRLSLRELILLLGERTGVEPRVPDDLPEDVRVTFARSQPLRVECRDGVVHLRVALDAIESGRRNWYDIVASVAYKPTASNPQVFLEREGPVQLSGPGHQGRVEFALRAIFSKIFPKERPIPVLPENLTKNPRLAGMHVLQAVSTDGWFAVAMGLREPPAAASVAAEPLPSVDARGPRRTLLR